MQQNKHTGKLRRFDESQPLTMNKINKYVTDLLAHIGSSQQQEEENKRRRETYVTRDPFISLFVIRGFLWLSDE